MSLFVVFGAAIVASGCRDDDDGDAREATGALRGELVATISDDLDGRSETRWALRERAGGEIPLVFVDAPTLDVGADVRVWGAFDPAPEVGFRVTRLEAVTPDTAVVQSPLRSATPQPSRSFAFVLLDMGAGVNTTSTDVMGRLITGADSIRNYYVADSYGTQDVTAQVFGPIHYALANGCGTSQLATDLRAMIPGTFQHYLWYFGSRQTACGWTGLASVGSPDKPSRDTWYNASTSCVVLVQEPGHNFGMQHSSSLTCPAGATFADDPNGCTASEYGDPFDPMGGGCRHMNAWQKDYQGWFGGCNGVTVTASGTFTLLPLEQRCDGVQFLKIPAPKVRTFNRPAAGGGGATVESLSHYYVELRTPQDFDGVLGNKTALAPQVLVHIGGDRRARTQRGLHTFLLDMTPSTTGRAGFADAALGVGKSFSDPAGGLTITVQAVSATQATIAVEIPGGAGGPTCLDDSPFSAPGPGPEACSAFTGAGGGGGAGMSGGGAGASGSAGASGAGGRGGAGAMGSAGAPGGGAGTPGSGAAGASSGGLAGASGGGAGTSGVAGAAGSGEIFGTAGMVGGAGASSGAAGPAGAPGGTTAGAHLIEGPVVGDGCACAAGGAGGSGVATVAGCALALAAVRRRRPAPSGRARA